MLVRATLSSPAPPAALRSPNSAGASVYPKFNAKGPTRLAVGVRLRLGQLHRGGSHSRDSTFAEVHPRQFSALVAESMIDELVEIRPHAGSSIQGIWATTNSQLTAANTQAS
jgi:hypothetical protein